MRVEDTTDVGMSAYIAVCMATTARWIGGSSPSRSVPSSPTLTTADSGWSRNDGAAVKYISSAPGTRRLTLPWPFAEIAPLATTRWATFTTWATRSLSIAPLHVRLAARAESARLARRLPVAVRSGHFGDEKTPSCAMRNAASRIIAGMSGRAASHE